MQTIRYEAQYQGQKFIETKDGGLSYVLLAKRPGETHWEAIKWASRMATCRRAMRKEIDLTLALPGGGSLAVAGTEYVITVCREIGTDHFSRYFGKNLMELGY